MLNQIIKSLKEKGYNVTVNEFSKNGVMKKGIFFMTSESNISPVIYVDEYLEKLESNTDTFENVVNEIIALYTQNKDVPIDVKSITSQSFVRDNVKIGLQAESSEDLLKTSCELDGIEIYMYVEMTNAIPSQACSYKLKKGMDKYLDIPLDELWSIAKKNTFKETTISNLYQCLPDMPEMEEDVFPPIYVVTNKSKFRGASAILDKQAIKQFAEEHNMTQVVVIPSSIHEMLILPVDESVDLEYFSAMVETVNETNVAPEDRLVNRAFLVTI